MSEEPFFRPVDVDPVSGAGRYHATQATAGPWFPDVQHLGPPAALLVRAFERCAPSRPVSDGAALPLQLARYTIEILGPVPTGDVEVSARIERPGRSIELLSGELTAGGRTVLSARAWRLGVGDTTAAASGSAAPLPGPDQGTDPGERPDGWLPGYLDAVEWRWLRSDWDTLGPGAAWGRLRVPVVEGEEPTPLQHTAAIADSANGIAAALDIRSWLFVNTELTVHLHRPPAAGWTGVDAATVIGPTGTGTVSGLLFDEAGQTGRITQELTVRPR